MRILFFTATPSGVEAKTLMFCAPSLDTATDKIYVSSSMSLFMVLAKTAQYTLYTYLHKIQW